MLIICNAKNTILSVGKNFEWERLCSFWAKPLPGRNTIFLLCLSDMRRLCQLATLQTKEGDESAPFRPKTAAVNRRHSVDVAPTSGAVARLHPYQRQFSDGASSSQGRLPQGTPGLGCLQQVCVCVCESDATNLSGCNMDQFSLRVLKAFRWILWTVFRISSFHSQSSYSDGAAAPVEPSCFLPPTYPNYRSLSPQRQVTDRLFSEACGHAMILTLAQNCKHFHLAQLDDVTNWQKCSYSVFKVIIINIIFTCELNSAVGQGV